MFSRSLAGLVSVLLVSVAIVPSALAGPPLVDLELLISPNTPVTASREWLETVKDLGFTNVRIRQGTNGDQPELITGGSPERPVYTVRGVITADNRLQLRGGQFRLGDQSGIRAWKEKLQDVGAEELTSKKVMYGLTAKQMLEVHEQLKGTIAFSTQDETAANVLNRLADEIGLELAAEGKAVEAVKSREPITDQLQGFAYGTALAAALRPVGCVFVPERKNGKLRLVIRDASEVERPWPVGWEVKGPPVKIAPKFYDVVPTKINDFTLSAALNAIGKRTELPFLFDRNNMLRQRVELDAVKVSTKEGRRTYASVVDDILYQGKLKGELRIDEAEKPFLWISTLRQ